MPYLSLPGVDLWFEDAGGPGDPVILLHAASGTTECWVHQLPSLHRRRLPLYLLRPPDLGSIAPHRFRPTAGICG